MVCVVSLERKTEAILIYADNPIFWKCLQVQSKERAKGTGRKSISEKKLRYYCISVQKNTVKEYLKIHRFHLYQLIFRNQPNEDDPDRKM